MYFTYCDYWINRSVILFHSSTPILFIFYSILCNELENVTRIAITHNFSTIAKVILNE